MYGFSFDCASQQEQELVQSQGVLLGSSHVPVGGVFHPLVPSVIYANPFKFPTQLEFAHKHAVRLMTADCPEELYKIKKHCPSAQVILRIAVDDSHSLCQFNSKFGMKPIHDNLYPFFNTLIELELDLVGVSFHVGSGCMSEKSYEDALFKTRYVFDFAKIQYDMDLYVIDLGGGFMQNEPLLTSVSQVIKKNLETLFEWTPEKTNLFVMAEPGRFMATNLFDLYVSVVGKKREWNEGRGTTTAVTKGKTSTVTPHKIKYYLNNSVYGAFNCKVFDYAVFEYEIWRHSNRTPTLIPSVVFGGTCDSLDKIIDEAMLPEMEVGDYMCFKNMGAYTMSASCEFNGLPLADIYPPIE